MQTTELTEIEPTTDVAVVSTEDCQVCENCHLPLNGPFCANCGQEANSTLKYFWVVIMHLLDDIFSFDSRVSRTLWPLVTRPAFLTNEYFSGRRVHYVPPLRLYLFISIVFFITLKFVVSTEDNNVITVSDKKNLITQIKSHVKDLETEKITLEKRIEDNIGNVEKINNTEKVDQLATDIARFTDYLNDLNSDHSEVSNNNKIIKLTQELVELEFEQVEEALSTKDKERFEHLITKRLKVKSGEDDSKDKKEFNLSSNGDGTLSFNFLSDESNKKLNLWAQEFNKKAEKAFNSDTGPLIEQVIGKLPQLMFILLPLFAVLLKVMFMFSNRLYMEHLTVALHSHSFIFITILLSEIIEVLQVYLADTSPKSAVFVGLVAGALLLWIPIYLFLMQKKVYKQSIFFTFVKFSIIGTIYSMMIMLTAAVAIVWGIMGT
jgi:hypothetical protein